MTPKEHKILYLRNQIKEKTELFEYFEWCICIDINHWLVEIFLEALILKKLGFFFPFTRAF